RRRRGLSASLRETEGRRAGVVGGRGRMARGIARGEVWTYQFARPDKRKPVVILSRPEAIDVLHAVMVAPITSTIRGRHARHAGSGAQVWQGGRGRAGGGPMGLGGLAGGGGTGEPGAGYGPPW